MDEFRSNYNKIIILKWETESSTCYCNRGFKYGVCSHRLALEIVHGKMKKVVMLAPLKKRGRKRKSPKALQYEEEQQQPKVKRIKKKAAIKRTGNLNN